MFDGKTPSKLGQIAENVGSGRVIAKKQLVMGREDYTVDWPVPILT